jgi:hypothetical protein
MGRQYHDEQCEGSRPLVLGAARGLRTFYLDHHGVLRGVTYKFPWRDGENVAQCMVAKNVDPMQKPRSRFGNVGAPYLMGGIEFPDDPDAEIKPSKGHEWDRCEGLSPDCGCGFYAYHTGEVQYATNGAGCRITAVVEAYGRVILGPLGYRAEKARIVAAVVPAPNAASSRRVALEHTRRDMLDARSAMGDKPKWYGCRLALAYASIGAAALVAGVVPGGMPLLGAGVLAGYAFGTALLIRKAARDEWKHTVEILEHEVRQCTRTISILPEDYSEWLERAKQRYPGVQWFPTRGHMLRAFEVESLASLAKENRDG